MEYNKLSTNNNRIPRIIHYCWFGGGKITNQINRITKSWEKFCPDFEIIKWDESNFDFSVNNYAREAYENKKWAFVSDYARLKILFEHGGIYMDTDVEVLKSLDNFLEHGAFTGCENEEMCVTGIMGAEKGHEWIKSLLVYYEGRNFLLPDGSHDKTTNTKTITNTTINKFGWIPKDTHQILKGDLNIYPFDFFCAKNFKTGEIEITNNTYTIHHFSGSWHTGTDKLKSIIIKIIGADMAKTLAKHYRKVKLFMKGVKE